MASTFGPRTPWIAQVPDLAAWDPMQDEWELFDTRTDYSLMKDLSSEHPGRLDEMKALFMQVAEENKVLPIGGGLYVGLNPQEMKRSTNTEWTLFEGMTRIPESQAPNVRNGNVRTEIEAGGQGRPEERRAEIAARCGWGSAAPAHTVKL